MEKRKIIFDVDTGIDDALAMAYAIRSNELQLLGMTTCFGNVTVETATRNTHYILDVLASDVPVYQGASRPLNGEDFDLKMKWKIHGKDGLGNCLPQSNAYKAEHQDAVRFIIDSIRNQPHEITLLFVGPLTNLAKVIQQAPDVIDLVKEVVIMGGAVTVPGNITPHAEANIQSDPEAAQIVMQSGLPIKLVGLDVTMQTLLSGKYVKEWAESESKVSQFYAGMTAHYIAAYEELNPGIGGCALHDPLAVGVILDPSFVSTRKMAVGVDITGEAAGRTFEADYGQGKPMIDVCVGVESERFLDHFLKTIEL